MCSCACRCCGVVCVLLQCVVVRSRCMSVRFGVLGFAHRPRRSRQRECGGAPRHRRIRRHDAGGGGGPAAALSSSFSSPPSQSPPRKKARPPSSNTHLSARRAESRGPKSSRSPPLQSPSPPLRNRPSPPPIAPLTAPSRTLNPAPRRTPRARAAAPRAPPRRRALAPAAPSARAPLGRRWRGARARPSRSAARGRNSPGGARTTRPRPFFVICVWLVIYVWLVLLYVCCVCKRRLRPRGFRVERKPRARACCGQVPAPPHTVHKQNTATAPPPPLTAAPRRSACAR